MGVSEKRENRKPVTVNQWHVSFTIKFEWRLASLGHCFIVHRVCCHVGYWLDSEIFHSFILLIFAYCHCKADRSNELILFGPFYRVKGKEWISALI